MIENQVEQDVIQEKEEPNIRSDSDGLLNDS